MKRAFDLLDEDRSGFLDVDELLGAATALGVPMEDNIKMLYGADQVDFKDFFTRMTSKLTKDDSVDDIMNIFELFDIDCTGTITMENLETIKHIIGAKEDTQTISDMLRMVDTDGDGSICPIDFYTCMVSGMRVRMDFEARRQLEASEDQMKQAQEMY